MNLADATCANNPYYLQFELEPGDPYVERNNLPLQCVFIGSIVCNDVDLNDLHDGTEPGYEGLIVNLYDCADTLNPIMTTVTDSLGQYRFDGLTAGDYRVQFVIPAGFRPIQGSLIGLDGFADCVTLDFGECDTTTSVCLILCPGVDAGQDVTICYGETTQLEASVPYGATGTYTWTPATGLNDPNVADPFASPLVTTEYIVTYDDGLGCGASDTITVFVLNTAPYLISGPADVTVECNVDPIPFVAPVFADSCDANLTVALDSIVSPLTCGYTIERTWTATNAQGNSTTYTQTVSVVDNIAPAITVVHPVFGPILDGDTLYADCSQVESFNFMVVNVFEICCLRPVDFQETNVFGDCEEDGYERIMYCGWTASDCCDNVSTLFFTVIVTDNTAPALSAAPADTTVLCGNLPLAPVLTATDDCDTTLTVVFSENEVFDANDCLMQVIRTWTVSDDCGNFDSHTQTITVIDTVPPSIVITNPLMLGVSDGDTIYVECNQAPSLSVGDVIVTDNCCASSTVVFQEFIPAASCQNDGYIQIMYCGWIATDCCGNADSLFFTAIILDNTPPQLFGVPTDATLACDGPTTPLPNVIAVDNCDNNVTVTMTADTTYNSCGYTILRTWTATDDCGNIGSDTQTVTVTDNIAPNIFNVPADMMADCSQIPPVPGNIVVSDNCDPAPTLDFEETITGSGCSYTIVRTWTATDACGNVRVRTQTIILNDNTPPVLVGLPADLTITCGTLPPAPPVVTATDNCDTSVSVQYFQLVNTTDPCHIIYNRIWTATDDCGNQANHHQHIHVVDNQGPVITVLDPDLVGVPSGDTLTFDCNSVPVLEEDEAIATDGCDPAPFIYRTEEILDYGDCENDGYLLLMRCGWAAYDACGNLSEYYVYFRVTDTTAPVIIGGVPADITIACDDPLPPVTANLIVTDNCDDTLDVDFDQIIILGDCIGSYTVERIWTVRDDCGNEAIATQAISVEDNTPPTFDPACQLVFNFYTSDGADCPATAVISLSEGDELSPFDNWTVAGQQLPNLAGCLFDNCSDQASLRARVASIEVTDDACSRTFTVRFDIVDACGNVSLEQFVCVASVTDNVAPVFSNVPADGTFSCDAIPAPGQVTATDDCDADVSITLVQDTVGTGCNYTITRTWTAEDDCGNTSSITQTITVFDDEAPVFTEPLDLTVSCGQVPAPVTPDLTDNCDDDLDIDFFELTGNFDTCSYEIKRIWTATDDCGNQATVDQTITVIDDTAPVLVFTHPLLAPLSDGDTLTMQCSNASIFGADDAVATDDCSIATVMFMEGPFNAGDCQIDGYVVLMECYWIAKDACGNADTTTLFMKIVDTILPTISNVPADVTINCGNSIPAFGTPAANDDCGSVALTFADDTTALSDCAYVITRTWTATDDCGNTAAASQSVTVVDSESPELVGIPANVAIECGDPIPPVANVTATDNCDANPIVTMTADTIYNNCGYQILRTWTAVDLCGNSRSNTQFITVTDTAEPVLQGVPGDVSIECGDPVPPVATVTATDNCDANPTVTMTADTIYNNSGYVIIRTWSASDECGNTAFGNQTITVTDASDPVLSGVPADLTVNLALGETIPPVANVTAFDDCDGDIPVVFEETTIDSICLYQIIRTWTATDAAGNSVSATQVITVLDPVIVNIAVTPDTCDQDNGTATLLPDTYSYEWSDGGTGNFREDLAAGDYTVTATNSGGCSEVFNLTIAAVCPCIPANVTSVDIVNANCGNQDGSATINLAGDEADYSYFWLPNHGTPNTAGNSRTGLPAGHYVVLMTYQGNPGCVEKVEFDVLDDCPPCSPIFGVNYLTIDVSGDPATVCLPVPFSVSQNHDIFVDGVPYALPLVQCNAQTVIFYSYAITVGAGQNGPYQVTWAYNNTTLNTIVNNMDELVAAMNAVDPFGFWYHNPGALGFASLNTGGNYGNMTITHIVTQIAAFIQPNFSSTPMGTQMTLPADATGIVYVHPDTGCSDTLYVNLNLVQPHPQIFEEKLVVTSVDCDFETPGYCLNIPYTELYQYSFTLNGQPYTGNFGVCNYMADHFYTYVSLPGLGYGGPYKLESWKVNGQTWSATFQTMPELVALMNQWDPAGAWTLNPTTMVIKGGMSMSAYGNMRIVQLNSGATAILELNTNYTPGTAYLDLPDGESIVIATRLSDGMQDTILVKIACLTPDYYKDVIKVGFVDTVCLSLDELIGDVASIENVCEAGPDAAAVLELIPGTNCVLCVGDHVGQSNACFVVCDEYGVCDTTYFEITVRDEAPSTLAPDTLYTDFGQTVIGQVLDNDQIEGDVLSVTIRTKPQHGAVTVNPDGSINYTPEEGYCNEGSEPDYFLYEVCTAAGCQTTAVYVYVGCGELVIYTGFSPNGDGINDFFRIDGLQRYPNHELTVFNRWGNRVFHSKNYKNDWDGTWSDRQLPDGTYFYLFNDGEGNTYSGYVQIRR